MGEFSITHIILLLVIVLIFFGPSRLPGLGKSLGEAIRGFKKGMEDAGKEPSKDENQNRHQVASRHVSPLELSDGDNQDVRQKSSHKNDSPS